MTPKEKALELFKLYKSYNVSSSKASDFALIAVLEIIRIFDDTNGADYRLEYWKDVESQIKKLPT